MTFPYLYGARPVEPGENFRLLITGDRNWTDKARIAEILKEFDPEQTILSHGGARGADRLAGEVAREMGMPVMVFHAKWEEHGRAAGPIRNNHMLVTTDPHLVVAFHNDIENSKGTGHMVRESAKKNYTVVVIEK